MLKSFRFRGHAPRRAVLAATLGWAALGAPLFASSHSDAPLIKQDPQANLTDVYAFIGTKYNNPNVKVLNVVVNVRPFSEPGDGPHYERFADDALYSVIITHPSSASMTLRYDFSFSAVDGPHKNGNTILSYGLGTQAGALENIDDPRRNYTQTYGVTRVSSAGFGWTSLMVGRDLITAPPNAGLRVTPAYNDSNTGFAVSGAQDVASLDLYTRQAVYELPTGEVVFAGPRDDSFFADVPGVFNLLDGRILDNDGELFEVDGVGQDGNGVDGFKGFNVLTYAIQIPVSQLKAASFNSVFFGTQTGVGVYASVSRQKTRVLNGDGTRSYSGPWMQVNRLANPIFNEVLVALKDKDKYNRTSPMQDAAMFATYAQNPELAFLINFVVFGDPTGQSPIATTGRADLANIYIPDVMRVITTTSPVPLNGQPGFHRLGFLGGDVTNGVSSGWPNGRRLGDDVVDIALTALVSGPSYQSILIVGDNVPSNDSVYNNVFPYAATPHSGAKNRKDAP